MKASLNVAYTQHSATQRLWEEYQKYKRLVIAFDFDNTIFDFHNLGLDVKDTIDLFVLLQVGNILNRQGVPFSLTIRYLMSARMDRVMSFNEAFSLEIVANAINSIHPTKVGLHEAHSERAVSLMYYLILGLIVNE